MAEALYRKYRPQVFGDVVGQDHIERTIKNAIAQDKVSHAYLFCGPRGTGKTTTARLLAKALLCENGPTASPDGTCEDCTMIANGVHPDVYELDAASRTGVDNVREEIIGRVQFAPTRGRYKIYIIDEVHMLSTAAFNALLKTLEEPPSHVVFVLATTDPQKVPETIHSRCQRFDFHRIGLDGIVARLGAVCTAEGVEFEGEALELIAHRAEGGMRNALTALEQAIAFSEGRVTLDVVSSLLGSLDSTDMAEIVKAIGTRDVAGCFTWTANYVETGADLAQFARDLAEHIRNLYVLSLAGSEATLRVSESERSQLVGELALFGPDRLARLLGVVGDLIAELKTSTNARLSFEIALTRMVRPDSDLTLAALAERIEALESSYSAVSHVVATAAPVAQPQPQVQAQPKPAVQSQPAAQAQRQEVVEKPVERVAEVAPAQEAKSQPAKAEPVVESAPARQVANSPAGALPEQLVAGFQNPASLQRTWQSAMSILKKQKTAYGVLFMNTKAVFDASRGALIIEFPPENGFAFNAVQKGDVQDAAAQAIAQACGASVPFNFRQGPDGTVGATFGTQAARSAVAQPLEAATVVREVRTETTASAVVRKETPIVAQPAKVEPVLAPDDDRVPLDAYDYPPYEDEVVPYDDGGYASYEEPVRRVAQSRPEPKPEPVPAYEPARTSVASEPIASDPLPAEPAGAPSSPDDLAAILAAGGFTGVDIQVI